MSMIDQAFSESVLRLQSWLQFLERKAAEYQTQMNRVRRSGGGTPSAEPVVAEPAPESASETTEGWVD